MGGPERVARQATAGRLTVRERINRLLDDGSFREVGGLAGKGAYSDGGQLEAFTPANCVMGRGRIDGRPVVVSGDDFTIRGGSADGSIPEKFKLAERMAFEYRLPMVRLIEGSGGGGSVKTLETRGRANLPGGLVSQGSSLQLCAANLGEVPVVALALGSVAGLGAAHQCAFWGVLVIHSGSGDDLFSKCREGESAAQGTHTDGRTQPPAQRFQQPDPTL